MTSAAEKILEQALSLPVDERRQLVRVLNHSLNADEANVSPAWKDEIGRRIAEVESGAVKPISWDEAEAQIKRVLSAS